VAWILIVVGLVAPRGSARADSYEDGTPALGARFDASGQNVRFRVGSSRAARVDLYLYAEPIGQAEAHRVSLQKEPQSNVWAATVPVSDMTSKGIKGTIYYGYRAWGPNWTFSGDWQPGKDSGFVADVDDQGNRFNPNKLLLDPYAAEISHDPVNPQVPDGTIYASGPAHRLQDTGPSAPKGIVLKPDHTPTGDKPQRKFKDDIIYEVHLRGFTKADPSIPESDRGTYRGAAQKAAYLKGLGITAVEFLPVQETPNDQNDMQAGTQGDNYWGYATLAFFAPDRRYARDRTPGGPTRELKAMVKAFHDAGIKVYIDVVYNHTGEGGIYRDGNRDLPDTANVLSWRGLDNPAYYELSADARFYYDNTGVGGNSNTAEKVDRDLILDSLGYWSKVLGVDGFRFDLAPVLGNADTRNGFDFEKLPADNPLNRAANELPSRLKTAVTGPGVELIAEPWALGAGTYQVGNFPTGWAEWNDHFRDSFRKAQNKLGVVPVAPAELARRFAGSDDLFRDDGRKPWHSVNFMVAHDGFTLRDLYAYNAKNNDQPFPFGPSDGGSDDNNSWDQGGDAAQQQQQARNGLAFLMLSAGTPMITGGDEMYRTQFGNNNAYNLDTGKNWLNWGDLPSHAHFHDYARRLIGFRAAHAALRPAEYFNGTDGNGNGLKDLTWYRDDGTEPGADYFNNPDNHFLAYRFDGTEAGDGSASILVAYNGWKDVVTITLPPNLPGKAWHRVSDTAAWMEPDGNFRDPGQEDRLIGRTYDMKGRSVLLLVEK
jgi:glycogen operon protein